MKDFIASDAPLSSDDSVRIIDHPEPQQHSRLVKTCEAKKKKSGNEEIIDAMHIKKQKRAKDKAKAKVHRWALKGSSTLLPITT